MPSSEHRSFRESLLTILRSRRVLIAAMTLLVSFLLMVVPVLEPVRGELLVLVITLALALIGGYSVEEAARMAHGGAMEQSPESLRTVIREIIFELLEEEDKEQVKDV